MRIPINPFHIDIDHVAAATIDNAGQAFWVFLLFFTTMGAFSLALQGLTGWTFIIPEDGIKSPEVGVCAGLFFGLVGIILGTILGVTLLSPT